MEDPDFVRGGLKDLDQIFNVLKYRRYAATVYDMAAIWLWIPTQLLVMEKIRRVESWIYF
jgi:hypothetical protein